MAGSTISSTIGREITLGSGAYLSPLTVTASGQILGPAPDTSFQNAAAIYSSLAGASLVNRGIISGAIPVTDTYTAPAIFAANVLDINNYGTIAGQSGIYLGNGGAISNSGRIAGTDARLEGGYGVRLLAAQLDNTGSVYGKRIGAAALNDSEITNYGSIGGGTAGIALFSTQAFAPGGTLANFGMVTGITSGVTAAGALIVNSGSIDGQSYGIRSAFGGSMENSGQISGGVDGVLLFNEQYQAKYATSFVNSGTILGGYFAMALNFATVGNSAAGLLSGTTFGAGVGDVGYLYNAGSIAGGLGGLLIESGGLAVSAGSIGGGQLGVELFADSIFTNSAGGYVRSSGTAALDQAAYLVNAGSLAGGIYGIDLLSGGIAIDAAGGTVIGGRDGVYLSTLSATSSPDFLVNDGTILSQQLGINLRNGTAYNYGVIRSSQIGASLVSGTSLDNAGEMYGMRYGVQLLGGTVTNTGSIGGGADGVRLSHGYLKDGGVIAGGNYAIYGQSFSLTIEPGASFGGRVVDKTGGSRLTLGGSSPAVLAGLGSQITGFATLAFAAGAQWQVDSSLAALTGGQVINGFEQGDTLVVSGISATSDSFVSGSGLRLYNGGNSVLLDITGSFSTGNFIVGSSGASTTVQLNATAPCFVAGTRILTPRGEVAVEDLRVGETLITQEGIDRPIIWIGRRSIALAAHPHPARVQPIRIAAGALGEGLPIRDLWLSPDHALLLDAHLVPAQLLLNGAGIRQPAAGGPRRARVTYYHIELSEHAIIFAEQTPVESYLETGNRQAFENGGAATFLHPEFSAMLRREKSCAPLLTGGRKLEEIRRATGRYRLEDRRIGA